MFGDVSATDSVTIMSDDAVVTTGSVDFSEVQNSVSGIASVVYGISSGGIVAAGVSDIAAGTGETITVTVSDVSENSLFNLVVTDGWVSEYVDINFCGADEDTEVVVIPDVEMFILSFTLLSGFF